jgi:preprotein translocase subunit YajC
MDDTPAKGGRGDRLPSVRDQVQMVEWPKKAKFLTARLHPGVVPVGVHKYPLFRKDGSPVISDKTKKQSELDKICLAFDPETMERDPDKSCPYCDAELYFKIDYYAEGLVREEVENEPAKHRPSKEEQKTGIKDFENDSSWTPNRVFRFTANSFKRLKSLKQLNKVMVDGEKQPMPVDDEEYGCDVNMNFDPDATGDGMYGMQRSDQCALTEEEQGYLHWDIEAAVEKATESEEEAQRNVDWYMKHAGGGEEGGDDDEPEEGDTVTIVDEDDEEFIGVVTEITDKKVVIEDDDGDEHTFRRSKIESMKVKPKKKGGKKPAKGDDDDDGDDEPKGRASKAGRKPAKGDDDDDTPPPKKGGKAKPEPEPEEEEEEEEEEGYEPDEGDEVIVKDEDGDELVRGTVTSIDKRKIVVTDEDGDEHSHKLAAVTVEPAPKKSKPAGKKPKPEPEEEEEEGYEPEEGDRVKVTEDDEEHIGVVTSINKRLIEIETDDGEELSFKRSAVEVEAAPKKGKPAGKKPKPEPEEEEDDDTPPPKKGGKAARSFDFDD